jgi:hypothetical protein
LQGWERQGQGRKKQPTPSEQTCKQPGSPAGPQRTCGLDTCTTTSSRRVASQQS